MPAQETIGQTANVTSDRELVLERILEASPEQLYKCWTTPELMPQWFCPKPWTVSNVRMDVRSGGNSYMEMNGPDGEVVPQPGVYLEVVPNKKIVFTDAFSEAWEPKENPFMVAIVTFEDLGDGKTRYRAVARHWTVENKVGHEQMGFHEGWGIVADQLEALAKTL